MIIISHQRHAVAPHCLPSSFDLMCCFCTAIKGDHSTIQARQETAGWPRCDRMFMRTARVFFRNPVVLHLYALLCDVRVSMINQSVIGVIYRSGGSVHTAGPTAGELAGPSQVRRYVTVFKTKAEPLRRPSGVRTRDEPPDMSPSVRTRADTYPAGYDHVGEIQFSQADLGTDD